MADGKLQANMGLNPKNALRKELRPYGGCKRWMYLFLCAECKKELWYERRIVFKQQGKCPRCAAKINAVQAHESVTKRPFEAIYNRLVKSASDRNLSCALTYESFLRFTNTHKCHYRGSSIVWSKHTGSVGQERDFLVED